MIIFSTEEGGMTNDPGQVVSEASKNRSAYGIAKNEEARSPCIKVVKEARQTALHTGEPMPTWTVKEIRRAAARFKTTTSTGLDA